jgi:hypothetical protein
MHERQYYDLRCSNAIDETIAINRQFPYGWIFELADSPAAIRQEV